MLSRNKAADLAQDIANHLQIPEQIRSLQTAQKEIADAIRRLEGRINEIEVELRVFKAEARLDALREAQAIVNAVQGNLNQRIEDLAVKVAVMEVKPNSHRTLDGSVTLPKPGPQLSLSSDPDM